MFWPLLVGSALTGILAFLMLAVWIIVPPLTSLMIYFDSTLDRTAPNLEPLVSR